MKMKHFRYQTAVVLAFAALFWLFAWVKGQAVRSYENDVQIRYQENGIKKEILDSMEEDGKTPEDGKVPENAGFPGLAAWNVEYHAEAENPSLSRKETVTNIVVKGDKSQVVKEQLAAGSYGYADDEEGCIISSGLAWKLFGSTNVVGQGIKVNGKRYFIRGVTAGTHPMVILSAGLTDPDTYYNLSLSYESRRNTAGKTKALMVQYGFPGNGTVIDGSFFGAAVALAETIPALALLFVLWRWPAYWFKADLIRKEIPERYRNIIRIGIQTGMAAAAVFLLVRGIHFPEEFLPTKWSDFDFYVQKYKQVRENFLQIALLPLSEWDVEVKNAFAASTLMAVEAALLIVLGGIYEIRFWCLKISVDTAVTLQEPEAEKEPSGLCNRDRQPDAVQSENHGHDDKENGNQAQRADE